MRELDPLIFSEDHGWRDIIMVLNECNEEFNSLRTTALTKYMQYLSSIDDTIGYIRKIRKESIGAQIEDQEKNLPEFGATWGPWSYAT